MFCCFGGLPNSTIMKQPKTKTEGVAVVEVTEYELTETERSASVDEAPDGGVAAWLQVLGASLLFFNSWYAPPFNHLMPVRLHDLRRGIVNLFGAFQAYYELNGLATSTTSAISWIGTIQGFLLIVVGVITGPLYDLGYLRALIGVGTTLLVLGIMTASLATEYYQIFLSLGVCAGVGAGCLYVPSVAVVSTWFSTKRGTATGITASAGSVAGVTFPIIFQALNNRIGFYWALRVMGFQALATLCLAGAILRPRIIPSAKRSLFEPAALREPSYLLFGIGLFLIFVGLYIPSFYVPSYALQSLHTSEDLAFYLLAMLHATSIPGRILPNMLADRVGAFNVLMPFTICTAVMAFAWSGVSSLGSFIAFVLLYGVFSGALVSLPPAALATLTPDRSRVGTRMGMAFGFAGVGMLVGSPIAGTVRRSASGFVGLEVFCGATVLSGAVALVASQLAYRRAIRNLGSGARLAAAKPRN